MRHSDSDSDLCINDSEDYHHGGSGGAAVAAGDISLTGNSIHNNNNNSSMGTVDSRVRRSSNGRVSIRLVSDERSTILATYKNIDH